MPFNDEKLTIIEVLQERRYDDRHALSVCPRSRLEIDPKRLF
jgi:hypothetical protein